MSFSKDILLLGSILTFFTLYIVRYYCIFSYFCCEDIWILEITYFGVRLGITITDINNKQDFEVLVEDRDDTNDKKVKMHYGILFYWLCGETLTPTLGILALIVI